MGNARKENKVKKLAKILASFVAAAFIFVPAASVSAIEVPEPEDGIIELSQGEQYDASSYVIPAGTTIKGNGATIKGSLVISGSNITIDNVKLVSNGNGIAISNNANADNVVISNNQFTGYKGHTIELSGVFNNLKIVNNTDDNHTSNNVQVVEAGKSDSITVSGNTFGSTVRVDGYADLLTTGIQVTQNNFESVPDTAVSIVKADGAVISGNKVTLGEGNQYANLVMGEVVNSSISDNTVAGNGKNTAISITTKDYADQYVGEASGVTVANNKVTSAKVAMLVAGAGDVTLDNNELSGRVGLQIGYSGIDNTGNVTIGKGNVISGDSTAISVAVDSLSDDAEIKISNEAIINGEISDKTHVVEYEEPTNPETPVNPDDSETPDVTEPVDGNTGDVTPPVSTDENANIAAPNTGVDAEMPSAFTVIAGCVAAILAAFYATKYATRNS